MIKKYKNKYGALTPEKCTNAYNVFATEVMHCEFLILYIINADELVQDNKELVNKKILEPYAGVTDVPELQKQLDVYLNKNVNDITNVWTYEQYLSQTIYARCVDNFLSYLKDILIEVINKDPRAMKSDEKETREFILNFNTMEELRAALASKKIDELSHINVPEINKFFQKRLGLKLLEDADDMENLDFTIKERNLIVHNRGIVTSDFIRDVSYFHGKEGYYITYSYKEISELNMELTNYAVEIDEKVSEKFKLDLIDTVKLLNDAIINEQPMFGEQTP